MSAFAFTTDGFPDGAGTNRANDARQVERLWSTTACTEGDWMAFFDNDTTNPSGATGKSIRAADNDDAESPNGTFGVACQTITGAGYVDVQVRGRVNTSDYGGGANVDHTSATAIGEDLMIGATAGRAIVYAASTAYARRIIGRCESTPGSNRAAVTIIPHPRFA